MKKQIRLGDLATYVNGYAFKPTDWENEGLPIIRIQNLTNSAGEYNYYNGSIDGKYLVRKGDILISWSASIGVYEWERGDSWLNQHIFKVVFDKIDIDKQYFKYVVGDVLKKSLKFAHGATMKHLTKSVFDDLVVPVYDFDEQKVIADKLWKVDRAIEESKVLINDLDLLVKSRFIEMFGDPVTNSKGYPIYKFSDITTSRLGKMLDKKRQTGKNQYPYLANYNVQWFRFELNTLNEMDFDEADRKEFELKYGDLLVCEGGEVGRCAIWKGEKENCFFQKALHRVRCDTNYVIPEYLGYTFYWHSQYNGFIDAISGVSTIAHLPGDRLKQLQIIVPPIELQNQFAGFVAITDKSKLSIQQSIETLQTLKAKLMQEYFG